MKPRELDFKIHKLKGNEIKTAGFLCLDGRSYEETYADHFKIPHYSTSIADAWELFEELPNPKLQFYNRDDVNTMRFVWEVCIDFNIDMRVKAATAPEAICLAWISWKESQIATNPPTL